MHATVLTRDAVEQNYGINSGKVIIETFSEINHMEIPGVLLAQHGPFTWGVTPAAAAMHARMLELAARLALTTLEITPQPTPLPEWLIDRHYLKKHQKNRNPARINRSL